MFGPQGPQGPQDCCPIEIDFSKFEGLCELMPRPQLVTGILVQWLRLHFTEAKNIENVFIRKSLWTDELETTKIVIDSVFRWNPAQTETRPGIFVKRGAWKVEMLGIDNRKMVRVNAGKCLERYNTVVRGSHTIFCIAGESAEAELLATEVYRELMCFSPIARKVFGFLRFVVTDITDMRILEEATENFVIAITVNYGADHVWEICPAGLIARIKKMQHPLE